MVKVAHVSDLHVGAFPRYEQLRRQTLTAFREIVEIVASEGYELMLISGDLFDVSHPSIEELREVAGLLQTLKESGVRVYAISGSHDITATRISVLEVYERSNLLHYINPRRHARYEGGRVALECIVDESLGIAVSGLPGLRRSLEIQLYSRGLIIRRGGPVVFMFHTGVSGADREAYGETMPVTLLPQLDNILYYAGGHIHSPALLKAPWSGAPIVYPGAPIGRDFNDLRRTALKLEEWSRKGFSRGFVRAELDLSSPAKARVEWVPLKGVPTPRYRLFTFQDASYREVVEEVREWIYSLKRDRVDVAIAELRGTVKEDISKKSILAPLYKAAGDVGITLHVSSTLVGKTPRLIAAHYEGRPLTDLELFKSLLREDYETAYRLFEILSEREPESGRKRDYVDRILANAKRLLGLEGEKQTASSGERRSSLLEYLGGPSDHKEG